MTPAETILWKHLRGRRFAKLKFRRQYPTGDYVVDFYCPACNLILEIDGETHLGKEHHDQRRQRCLEDQGCKVLRFWNNDVYDDLETVLEAIWQECQRQTKNAPELK